MFSVIQRLKYNRPRFCGRICHFNLETKCDIFTQYTNEPSINFYYKNAPKKRHPICSNVVHIPLYVYSEPNATRVHALPTLPVLSTVSPALGQGGVAKSNGVYL